MNKAGMENLSPQLINRLRKIKLIATDLDGTLLNNRSEISKVTLENVRKLKDIGIAVAVMTARAHSSAERIADQLGVAAPIVSLDGGLVRMPHERQNIFASYISPRVVKRTIAESDRRLASIILFVDDKMVHRESEVMIPSYVENLELGTYESDDLSSFADRTIQIVVGADSRSVVRGVARKAVGLFRRIDVKLYRSSQYDDRWYLEMKNKSHSKATGLTHLEKYFHVGRDEVAVLGDFRNDIAAFKRAGVSVAMKNAVWELKERADIITESTNYEDGAAEFFEMMIKLKVDHKSKDIYGR